MKSRFLVAVAVTLMFAAAGSFSSVWAQTQQQQQQAPKKGQIHPTLQPVPETNTQNQPGETGRLGGETMLDHEFVIARVDSIIQRMTMLTERTRSYSKSFGSLAATHHGADKAEILMMQRMSESMGTMAGEVKLSLQQYKNLLEDEPSSENWKTRAEVQNLDAALNNIASYIEHAVNTLQTLQEHYGQG
ncbi:MAG: hypothetical protein PVF33_08485 [Candidatus Latescibacterota bacterium]|jgi:hypothetical protein